MENYEFEKYLANLDNLKSKLDQYGKELPILVSLEKPKLDNLSRRLVRYEK
tara:strand:+ start:63 stop:215 length:153 start_codon:yes stop_codon:yes gene_type:complete